MVFKENAKLCNYGGLMIPVKDMAACKEEACPRKITKLKDISNAG